MNIYQITRQNYIPIKCTYDIIYRCNLKCVHCFQENNINNRFEPSFEDIVNTVSELKKIGCMELLLSGGEVFLRNDIFELLEFLKNIKMGVVLFTNGTLLDENKVIKLSKMYVFYVGISIYGSNEYVHDSITQVNGSFQKSINAIKLLKKYGVRVVGKIVAMKCNAHDIKNTIDMLRGLDVEYEISPFISEGVYNDVKPLKNRMTDEQIISCARATRPLSEAYSPTSSQNIEEQLLCGAGSVTMHIAANGDVFPCMSIYRTAGNAYNHSLSEIWRNADVFRKFRNIKYVDSECSRCVNANICTRCPGVALEENGSFTTKPKEFCRITELWKKAYGDADTKK